MATEFATTLTDGVVYFADTTDRPVALPLVNNPTTLISIRNESYTDKNKLQHTSWNISININAVVTPEEGITYINSADATKSTVFKKSIRHAKGIVKAFKDHKSKASDQTVIYDNEFDKKDGGSIKIQFNQGLPAMQHGQMVEAGIEYCKLTNIKKAYTAKSGRVQPQTSCILGGDDVERFARVCADAKSFHTANEALLSAEHHNGITISTILANYENSKKRKLPSSAVGCPPTPTHTPLTKKKANKLPSIAAPPPEEAESEAESIDEIECTESD